MCQTEPNCDRGQVSGFFAELSRRWSDPAEFGFAQVQTSACKFCPTLHFSYMRVPGIRWSTLAKSIGFFGSAQTTRWLYRAYFELIAL